MQLTVDAEGLQRFAVKFNEAKTKIETTSPRHTGKELVGFHIPQLEEWAEGQVIEDNDDEEEESEDEDDEGESEGEDEVERVDKEKRISSSEIPAPLLEYSTLPKDFPEQFGYLSTELSDTVTDCDLQDSSGDRAADNVWNILTIPAITIPSLNESATTIPVKGPLIQELPQCDDSGLVVNNHSWSASSSGGSSGGGSSSSGSSSTISSGNSNYKGSNTNNSSAGEGFECPTEQSESPPVGEENQLVKSMETIRLL